MKRILLLSTFFYPTPSVGSVRITNWAKVLPGLGYLPLVICRDYGYRASPENLATNVHDDVRVLQLQNNGQAAPAEEQTPVSLQARNMARQGLLTRMISATLHQFVLPDAQWLFWKRNYPNVLAYAREFQPDVILSTVPSFSMHELARRLKRDLTVPWIADYRDPMLLDDRFIPQGFTRIMWPRYAAFERRIYEQADAVVHAIPLHGRWARLHYPFARKRCAILRHPVPLDLAGGEVTPLQSREPDRRSINVVGFIRPQIVGMLADAINSLIAENPRQYDLELRLIGRELDDSQTLQALLGERLIVTGRVRHDIAKQYIAGADVLVNAVSSERQGATNISSKLYEYAAAKKPIVAINPTRSDRLLLRELPAIVVERPTVEVITKALRQALACPAGKESSQEAFLAKYSWEGHCQRLAVVIESVTNKGHGENDLRDIDSLVSSRIP
jgi:glycosyltransferase involved in cell wall biosynthesis